MRKATCKPDANNGLVKTMQDSSEVATDPHPTEQESCQQLDAARFRHDVSMDVVDLCSH
jgi:hypothetical protein